MRYDDGYYGGAFGRGGYDRDFGGDGWARGGRPARYAWGNKVDGGYDGDLARRRYVGYDNNFRARGRYGRDFAGYDRDLRRGASYGDDYGERHWHNVAGGRGDVHVERPAMDEVDFMGRPYPRGAGDARPRGLEMQEHRQRYDRAFMDTPGAGGYMRGAGYGARPRYDRDYAEDYHPRRTIFGGNWPIPRRGRWLSRWF